MRKKLETRFPASRIKKIMQADEDVGKIALAVPVLVSKALELFLQDLCDRTYQITLERGAKTVNSTHLKQCVKTYSEFDFLSEIVNKVPSLGGSSEPSGDEMVISRRRKSLAVDSNMGYPEDTKPPTKVPMTFLNPSPRAGSRGGGVGGRGRGRGRGRPPKRKEVNYEPIEEETDSFSDKNNPFSQKISFHSDEPVPQPVAEPVPEPVPEPVQLQEPVPTQPPAVPTGETGESITTGEIKSTGEESQVDELAPWGVDPAGSVRVTMQIDEDEDYDNED